MHTTAQKMVYIIMLFIKNYPNKSVQVEILFYSREIGKEHNNLETRDRNSEGFFPLISENPWHHINWTDTVHLKKHKIIVNYHLLRQNWSAWTLSSFNSAGHLPVSLVILTLAVFSITKYFNFSVTKFLPTTSKVS